MNFQFSTLPSNVDTKSIYNTTLYEHTGIGCTATSNGTMDVTPGVRTVSQHESAWKETTFCGIASIFLVDISQDLKVMYQRLFNEP